MNGDEKLKILPWKMFLPMFLLVLTWACGYQLVGKDTHLPPGVTSIAIPTFANKTYEPGIEVPFTQAFLTEFIRDRRVKVLDKREADSVLEGTIKSFTFQSVSYDQAGLVSEYQTTVVVDLTLKRQSGEIVWRENNLTEKRWFRTSSAVLFNEDNKTNAIRETGALVAERIRNRFFSNF